MDEKQTIGENNRLLHVRDIPSRTPHASADPEKAMLFEGAAESGRAEAKRQHESTAAEGIVDNTQVTLLLRKRLRYDLST